MTDAEIQAITDGYMDEALATANSKNGNSITVATDNNFTTEALRNTYFTANPTKLIEGMYITCAGILQHRVNNDWIDSSAVVKGSKGDPGNSATATVGTVTQLPSTTPPTVTNSGTASSAVFNFGIPQGAKGNDGISVVATNAEAIAGTSTTTAMSPASTKAVFDDRIVTSSEYSGATNSPTYDDKVVSHKVYKDAMDWNSVARLSMLSRLDALDVGTVKVFIDIPLRTVTYTVFFVFAGESDVVYDDRFMYTDECDVNGYCELPDLQGNQKYKVHLVNHSTGEIVSSIDIITVSGKPTMLKASLVGIEYENNKPVSTVITPIVGIESTYETDDTCFTFAKLGTTNTITGIRQGETRNILVFPKYHKNMRVTSISCQFGGVAQYINAQYIEKLESTAFIEDESTLLDVDLSSLTEVAGGFAVTVVPKLERLYVPKLINITGSINIDLSSPNLVIHCANGSKLHQWCIDNNATHVAVGARAINVYADNTTARANGLAVGMTYRTPTGQLMITY